MSVMVRRYELGSSRENISALQASGHYAVFGIDFADLAYRLPTRTTALHGGQSRLTMRSAQQAAHSSKIVSMSSVNVDELIMNPTLSFTSIRLPTLIT